MEKITISWFDDKHTTILVTYNEDGWTWDDLFVTFKEQYALIDSVDYPVDVVVDVLKSTWMPRGGSLLTPIRKFMSEQHPRQGKTIFIGARGMLASIIGVLGTMMGPRRQDLIFVKTMEEVQPRLTRIATQRQQEADKKNSRIST